MHHRLTPILALTAALACAPKDDATTDATSGETDATSSETDAATDAATEPTGGEAAACPEHPDVDACCCFTNGGSFVDVACEPVKKPCAKVDLTCGDSLDTPKSGVCTEATDEAALDCALQALADGEPGMLELSYHASDFYWYGTLELYLQGDGTMYKLETEAVDLSEVYFPTGRFAVQPAAFFTDCLSKDLAAKAECLKHPIMGAITEQCVGEVVNNDI